MKDAFYFKHDSNARHDPKIGALRSVYGMEGYGRYWALIEMLRDEADYKLMLTKYVWNAIALQLQCTAQEAEKFVQDCISEFELFESDGKAFWSDSLLRRMSGLEDKKEKAKKAAEVRWNKVRQDSVDAKTCNDDASVMQPHSEPNAIREDKNILDKKIEEKKIKKNAREGDRGHPVDNSSGEVCPKCKGQGWYLEDVAFNNGLGKKSTAVECDCVKKKPPWAVGG